MGITDTITEQTGLALDSSFTTSLYNPLAAVPSLHCGFAVSVALVAALRGRWPRLLAAAWAPTIFLAVVATGNHFVFAAGIAITALGYAVTRLPERRREPGLRAGADAGAGMNHARALPRPHVGSDGCGRIPLKAYGFRNCRLQKKEWSTSVIRARSHTSSDSCSITSS